MKTIVLLMFTLSSLLTSCCDWLAPGGLNGTESYDLSASREQVVKAVQVFKSEHPEMCPSDTLRFKEGFAKDTKGNDITIWYDVYLYYPERNEYVLFLISDEQGAAQVILVSIIDGYKLGGEGSASRKVGKLSKGEKKIALSEFEERILNPIKEILARKPIALL